MPSSVTRIDEEAFRENNLNKVDLPESLRSLGGGTFTNNNLSTIKIPSGISTIGVNTFSGNKLTSIDLPAGLKRIEQYAFYDNQISNIVIPDSVTYVKSNAFASNPLKEVNVSKYYDYLSWVPEGVDVTRRENVVPSDISASLDSVDETESGNSAVSVFYTTDEYGDSHTYSLVAGEGDDDNASFDIVDNILLIKESPDFETKSTYS